jgi:hypothetical protein
MGGACSPNEMRNACNVFFFFLENLKGRDRLEDLSIDGKLLKWTLGKERGKV